MNKSGLYISVVGILLAGTSCMQNTLPPQELTAPEFTSINCRVSESSDNNIATLTAELNSSNGIERSGFMFGKNEAHLKFVQAPISDCILATEISDLEPGDYLYYATVSNGRNSVRTKMLSFTVKKTPESSITTTPPDGGDSQGGGDNQGGSDSSIITPPAGDGDGTNPPAGDGDGEETTPPAGDGTTPPAGGGSGTDDSGNSGGFDTSNAKLPISDDGFFAYLLDNFDANNDGYITKGEADAATEIEVCTDAIKTLDGIQYFGNLERLICKGSTSRGALTALVVPNANLKVLDCSYNNLTDLAIPSSLIELNCRYNELHYVNIPKCDIKKLDIFGNYITTLNLYMLKDLEELVCGMNSIRALDVSQNLKLKKLDCSDSPLLDSIYVSRNHKIDEIIAENRIVITYKD